MFASKTCTQTHRSDPQLRIVSNYAQFPSFSSHRIPKHFSITGSRYAGMINRLISGSVTRTQPPRQLSKRVRRAFTPCAEAPTINRARHELFPKVCVGTSKQTDGSSLGDLKCNPSFANRFGKWLVLIHRGGTRRDWKIGKMRGSGGGGLLSAVAGDELFQEWIPFEMSEWLKVNFEIRLMNKFELKTSVPTVIDDSKFEKIFQEIMTWGGFARKLRSRWIWLDCLNFFVKVF